MIFIWCKKVIVMSDITLKKRYAYKQSKLSLGLLFTMWLPGVAMSAPGVISDTPLPFAVTPKPNVLILLDDSGSMNYNQVVRRGAQDAHNLTSSGTAAGKSVPGSIGLVYDSGAAGSDISLWELCAGLNGIAFTPEFEYTPWEGFDTNGNAYENMVPELNSDGSLKKLMAFHDSPYNGRGWKVKNLISAMYIKWDDSDADGEYDAGECGGGIDSYEATKLDGYTYKIGDTASSTHAFGVLQDSGGPGSNYADNENASFTINVAGGAGGNITFKVQFLNFDGGDRLTIHQGTSSAGTVVQELTSSNQDKSYLNKSSDFSFTVSGSQAHIVFSSDDEYNRNGFQLTWQHSGTALPNDATEVEEVVKDGVMTIDECETSVNCLFVRDLEPTEPTKITGDDGEETEVFNTQQNYANWYSYYRQRQKVATQALSAVINDEDLNIRLGLATINLNKNNGAVIKDMGVAVNKENLANRLFSVKYGSGTPLRVAFLNTGRYFDAHDNPDSRFFGPDVDAEHAADEFTISDTPGSARGGVVGSGGNSGFYSPILNEDLGGQCQQNFALLFTDGEYADTLSETQKDIIGGNVDGSEENHLDGRIYADDYSYTLADIALKYFKKDLSENESTGDDLLEDKIENLTLHEEAVNYQHMRTYAIAFGVSGSLSEVPPVTEVSSSGITTVVNEWPEATTNQLDDLRHAAFNGRGEYYSAFDTKELVQSIEDIIVDISDDDRAGVGGTFTSSFVDKDSLRFQSTYSTEGWWGELKAFEYRDVGNEFSTTESWSADAILRADADRKTNRQIITFNGTEAIRFAFPVDYNNLVITGGEATDFTLSQSQVDDLLVNAPYSNDVILNNEELTQEDKNTRIAANNAYGAALVDYLRGDDAYDGKTSDAVDSIPSQAQDSDVNVTIFRDRFDHYLGGFVNSQTVYVDGPSEGYQNSTIAIEGYDSYVGDNSFADNYGDRRPMIYVGGNDGMLHGFYVADDAGVVENGGQEVFAYIPSMVSDSSQGGSGLYQLAQSTYTNSPYVDGKIDTGDVYLDQDDSDGSGQPLWRTYLTGGLSGGGKGIYVLDITDPSVLSTAEANPEKVLVKEFTNESLGHVYGKPYITLMNNGRWAAVVSNGYNNAPLGDGTPKLFIVYLDDKSVGDAEGTNGIFNYGKGDYSVIDTTNRSWTYVCNASGDNDCTAFSLDPTDDANDVSSVYLRATYKNDSDSELSYRYHEFSASTYPANFTCSTQLFGEVIGSTIQSCDVSDRDANGLSPSTLVDIDQDFTTDLVYAGDLHGNVWVFDVSDDNADEWGVDDGHTLSNKPLFTACSGTLDNGLCAQEERQPITAELEVVQDKIKDEIDGKRNILVFFGTGQYVAQTDKSDARPQSFYGVWDAGPSESGAYRELTKDNLDERSTSLIDNLTSSNGNRQIDVDTEPFAYGIASDESVVDGEPAPDYYFGWFLPLPDEKERVYIAAQEFSSLIVFATIVPEDIECSESAGYSYLMAMNLVDGKAAGFGPFGQDSNDKDIDGVKIGDIIVGFTITSSNDGTGNTDSVSYDVSNGRGGDREIGDGEGDEEREINAKRAGIKSWSILK